MRNVKSVLSSLVVGLLFAAAFMWAPPPHWARATPPPVVEELAGAPGAPHAEQFAQVELPAEAPALVPEAVPRAAADAPVLDFVSDAIGRAVDSGQWLAAGVLLLYGVLRFLLPRLARRFPRLGSPAGKRAGALALGTLGTLGASVAAGRPITIGLLVACVCAALATMGFADIVHNAQAAPAPAPEGGR